MRLDRRRRTWGDTTARRETTWRRLIGEDHRLASQDLIFFITARATLNTLLDSDRTVHVDTLLTIKYVTANTIPTRPAITATTIPMTTGTCTELVVVGVGDAVWPPRAGVGWSNIDE